jgi:hypothetical protein
VKQDDVKKERNFHLSDLLVLLICIAGALCSLWFFQNDMNRALTRMNEQPVGTVTYKYRAAQRRFADRVLWSRVQRESPVYNGDYIRTAELSEANISFSNGALVSLTENSMIQVFLDAGGAKVDFARGGISVDAAGAALFLSSGANQVAVRDGAMNAVSADGSFDLRVTGGQVSFATPEGEQEAGSGSAFSFLEGGVVESPPQAVVISPAPAARVLNVRPDPMPIEFVWNRVNYSASMATRIEIARDRGFQHILTALEEPENDRTVVSLPSGVWWWRVSPTGAEAGEDGGAGTAGRLAVIDASPPAVISPAEGDLYRYQSKAPELRFVWKGTEEAAYYILEAADNDAFSNSRISSQVRGAAGGLVSLISSQLEEGRWFWRVTPVYGKDYTGSPVSSETVSFSITRKRELDPPVLNTPVSGEGVNIGVDRKDLYFSWRRDAEAVSYRILISPQEDLGDPLIQSDVKTNYYVYGTAETALREGSWYWGVYALDGEGGLSPLSEVRPVRAVSPGFVQETIYPPDNYTVADTLLPDLRFTWKTNLPYQIRFQISPDPSFDSLVVNEASGGNSSQGQSLPPGDYYWRILADTLADTGGHTGDTGEDAEGRVLASSPKRLRVAGILAAPVVISAGEKARTGEGWVVVKRGEEAAFSWQPLEDADYYHFRLFGQAEDGVPSAAPLYESARVEGASVSISMDDYDEGTYYWSVQGFVDEKAGSSRRTGLMSLEEFNFRTTRNVALDYPPAGTELPGREAMRRGGTVRWSSIDTPGQARFILSRNRNLSGPRIMDLNNPGNTVTLPSLTAGDYYWTIQARTAGGIDISAERPSWFRVLPPQAEAVTLVSPSDGAEVPGLDALRRPGTVRWSSAEKTRNVRFVLSRNANLSRPLAETVNPPASVTLPRLAAGDYYWTIRAETEDGIDISAKPFLYRVLTPPLLDQAANRQPGDGYVFGVEQLRTSPSIAFSWDRVAGANSYTLSLFREGAGGERERVHSIGGLSTPGYTLKDLSVLDHGRFVWELEALSRGPDGAVEQHGVIGENWFDVNLPQLRRGQLKESETLYGL